MTTDEQQIQEKAFLDGIRNALSITWEDTETDTQLTGIIARGMAYLNSIAGGDVDYMLEDKGRELLIAYCLYARANALDQFTANYQADLMYFQLGEEVKRYRENTDSASVP